MTRQLYELEHPLYPHKDLRKHHEIHKVDYVSQHGTYDDAYRNWYQIVRADHDVSGAPKRPIYREISQIMRQKSSGKEFLTYGETLIGFDHENNPVPFFHTYGTYTKPFFRTTYNYEQQKAYTIRSGQSELVYFIEYTPELLDELYAAGPDNMDIELLVTVGSVQYGGRGFYTYNEFRDLPLEELARMGREGKGQFPTNTTNIPVGTMISQLKHEGFDINKEDTAELQREFAEFVKWKNQQQQQQQQPPQIKQSSTTASKFTIKESNKDGQQQ